ncbi:LysM peptidoglycan-binding domain-containing protein [Deinococcus cavernae]|uniref:LysM peptidoglycan-binding domain-containing protein n=1 Tax=Deinococcus cavernae TaxID=2320857 RepID=A0A418V5K3_9DEIO|nr:LysM peptidoglycan-binding domain-containing protein [Deinococcus cavernae]RJF71295.1 LysM peptidoglycan-binding domain-containing protein [Deinococcus cavernae]
MWPFGKSTKDRVAEALNAQPRLQNLGLQVTEQGGNVRVTGMVPNGRYGNLVKVVAEGINGVKSVDVSGLVAQQETSTAQAGSTSAGTGTSAGTATPAAQTPDIQMGEKTMTQQSAGTAELDDQAFEEQSKIAKAVLSAIRSNGELSDDPIDVLQSGKSVILRGAVDNDHELRLLEQVARAVSGVAGVDTSGVKVTVGTKELAKEKDTESGDTVYTVKSGDTLSEIAQKYYGDAMEYKKIAHYNNISNPDLIQPGQKIRIPG